MSDYEQTFIQLFVDKYIKQNARDELVERLAAKCPPSMMRALTSRPFSVNTTRPTSRAEVTSPTAITRAPFSNSVTSSMGTRMARAVGAHAKQAASAAQTSRAFFIGQ
jgi:hypothetical protein